MSALLFWSTCASAGLSGEPPPDEDITVIGRSSAPEDEQGAVTVVQTEDMPASADVADAVSRAPGAVVRRLGGVGDFAQVSVRGAGARRVEVLLDTIPLNPEGAAAVDLSELPLRAFERVEIYRGTAPALLGSAAMGGVVSLVPGREVGADLRLMAGSTLGLRGQGSVGLAHAQTGHLWLSAEGLLDEGRYRYLDDGATRGETGDDRLAWRENNDNRSLSTLVRAEHGRVSLLYSGVLRDDGVPGAVFAPSMRARYGLQRHLVGMRLHAPLGAGEIGGRLYALHRADRLEDPASEVGIGSGGSLDRTAALGLDGSLRSLLSRSWRAELSLGGRLDRYQGELSSAERLVSRAIVSLPWRTERAALSPALLALVLAPLDGAEAAPVAFVLPRLSAGLSLPWRARLEGNAGLSARPPDLLELYGDRGALVGNPSLSPERGTQGDLGVAWASSRARLEVVAFGASYQGLIVWATGPQGVARPENIAGAFVSGLEIAASAERGALSLAAQLALTRAMNRSDDPSYRGNQLPWEPIAEGGLQMGLQRGPFAARLDATGMAGAFSDTANVNRQPPRLLLGASCVLQDKRRRFAVDLDVRNLLGTITAPVPRDPLVDDGITVRQPMTDFVGYPLPGRVVWLALRWQLSPR